MFPSVYDVRSPLVLEDFNLNGTPDRLPQEFTSSPADAFSCYSYLQPVTEGELIYQGTRLNDLRYHTPTYSRYNVLVGFRGFRGANCSLDFHFEIRQRRSSNNTYVGCEVNSDGDSITLFEKQSGVTTATATFNHLFNLNRFNWLELWVYDNKAYVLVNGGFIGELTVSTSTEDGFSLYAYPSADGTFCRFYQLQAKELEPQPSEQLDGTDLFVVLRQTIRNQVNNPIPGDIAEFKRVWNLWFANKDLPIPDHQWWEMGFPLREPPVEEWELG